MKILYGFILLFLIGKSTAYGQTSELMSHAGVMTERVRMDSSGQYLGFNFLSFHLGAYRPFVHHQDVVSLGVDGSMQGGFQLAGGKLSFLMQMPIFLLGRYGIGATSFNSQKAGVGIGIGANMSYMNIKGLNDLDQNDFRFSSFFINPSLLIEGSMQAGKNPIIARLRISFAGPSQEGILPVANPGDLLLFEKRRTSYMSLGWGLAYVF